MPPVSLQDFPSASTYKIKMLESVFANAPEDWKTYKVTKTGGGSANTNVVLSTLSWECLCVLARNTSGVEEVVVIAVLELV